MCIRDRSDVWSQRKTNPKSEVAPAEVCKAHREHKELQYHFNNTSFHYQVPKYPFSITTIILTICKQTASRAEHDIDVEKSWAKAYASMPASYIANYIYCTIANFQYQLRFPVPWISALKSYIIGWSCQNLSSIFLKVLTVSDITTQLGRLFQTFSALLVK